MIVRPLQVLEPKPVGTIRPFTRRKHSGAHRGGECRWHRGHCAKPHPELRRHRLLNLVSLWNNQNSAPPRPKTGICGFYRDSGPALRAVRVSSQGAQKLWRTITGGPRLSQERAYVARLSPDSDHAERRHHRLIRSPRRRGRAAWKGVRGQASSQFLDLLSAETEPDVRLANLPAWRPAAPCAP